MPDTSSTLAYLHAHGLDVEPEGLSHAVMLALQEVAVYCYAEPGAEGLTAAEVEVAQSGGLAPEPAPGRVDPLVRGVAAYASLVASGFTTHQGAARLGVSDARVRQRIKEGTLVAIRDGAAWKLPAFQFTDRGELPGWAEVARGIPRGVSPVAVERWLTSPHPDLVASKREVATSPRSWLLEGRPPRVVADLAAELG